MTLPGGIPPTLVPEAGAVLAALAAKATSGSFMFEPWTFSSGLAPYLGLYGFTFPSHVPSFHLPAGSPLWLGSHGYHGLIRAPFPSLIRQPTWRLIITSSYFKGLHSNRRSNCQLSLCVGHVTPASSFTASVCHVTGSPLLCGPLCGSSPIG